jgi:Uma2 family endonuclease
MDDHVPKWPEHGAWTVEPFRAFYEATPDEERWELIDGVAVMMTSAMPVHQRLASNLERLLNDALESHDLSKMAFQRIGLDLTPVNDRYHPEPDVSVLDAELVPGQRYGERFYLAAEIISESDGEPVRRGGRARFELKRDVYREHSFCTAILAVSQKEISVMLDRRGPAGWATETLKGPDASLDHPEFGLRCTLADLYRRTPLLRAV